MTRIDYRVLVLTLCAFVAICASAQTYTELLKFDGTSAAGPETPLTQGIDGNLYGTTFYGGTGGCTGSGIGCGVVFKIGHNRQLQILYNFQSNGPTYPINDLILGNDGNLYGTTGSAYGIIFKITPGGIFTIVYRFLGGTGGEGPLGGLIQGADGDFYGTTIRGGAPSNSCPSGCGTVFKMTRAGVLTTLYSFCPQNYCPDGENPRGTLAQGVDGNFYGIATAGGVYKHGTFFKITPDGTFTLLYTFESVYPLGGLILANDGNFYGPAGYQLFQVTPRGAFTALPGNGYPPSLPIQGSDGNLYFTNFSSGTDGLGGVFDQMPPSGSPSTLYRFAGYPNDGSNPTTSLVQATDGKFYGTTFTGGPYPCNYGETPGCGTIYGLDMGLKPFVAFVNRASRVGQKFGILGENFAGTSSVSINGTPATFTVRSNTLLIATVPAGATTGYVMVATPSRVLKSNVPFYVIP